MITEHAMDIPFRETDNSLPQVAASPGGLWTAAREPTLAPETVRPEQFFHPPVYKKQGTVALMGAVLDAALNDFQQQFVKRGQRAQRLAREAEEWLFSDDTSWPFSFVNICAVLELEPAYLRQGLKRWKAYAPHEPPPRRQRSVLTPRHPLAAAA